MSKMFMLLTILTPFLIVISCIASAFFGFVTSFLKETIKVSK